MFGSRRVDNNYVLWLIGKENKENMVWKCIQIGF